MSVYESPVTEAIILAAHAHDGQTDEHGAPYILHPLAVMGMAQNDTERIVAVLHDVVEDTPTPLALLDILFGTEVMRAVEALTKREHEDYHDFIQRAKANPIARQVKQYDIRHNLSRPPVKSPWKQNVLTERYLLALDELGPDPVKLSVTC